MIISDGYNGTPTGFENCCEDDEGLTRWDVLHAEANAILKVARSTPAKDPLCILHCHHVKSVVN
jgi:deoxycytidylate deaminase